uniref:Uncharacterized protein n=1 Tax=Arundo donax TaxID=35708 RepID=A0A0A9C5V3_ARUDO
MMSLRVIYANIIPKYT